jgi:lipopolysaccharide/colanic/teichoic acid biosynthesis glycosyltransferase
MSEDDYQLRLPPVPDHPIRRRGKEMRERAIAAAMTVLLSPLFLACAAAIKLESLIRPAARGPVFFREDRISRGAVFKLMKFRVLPASALAGLGEGPTHIAVNERAGDLTLVGKVLKAWYLDELPQLLNIVKGDMFLIGTRPWPIELYLEEMGEGVTRKRDMPAGLIGPVQSHKGDPSDPDGRELDADYWAAFQSLGAFEMLRLDARIVTRSIKVFLDHRGI